MAKELLVEHSIFNFSHKLIKESIESNGSLVVSGLLQMADVKNGNGRVYPLHILKREAQKYLDGPIKERRSLGEADHPAESTVISFQNASHWIRNIWWVDNQLFGELELLDTPSGRIVTELFKKGLTVGVSSRAMGSVKQLGEVIQVQDDLELICWDFVSTPSTPGAYMTPMNESINLTESTCNKMNNISALVTEIISNRGNILKNT